LLVSKLGLGTASRFRVLAKHRSGLQVPTPLRGYSNTKRTGQSRFVLILRDIRDAVGTKIRAHKGYLSIPDLIIENTPD
jgi:hypothetical protein